MYSKCQKKLYIKKDILLRETTNNKNLCQKAICTSYLQHKYILTNASNTFQINHQQQALGKDMYDNAHIQTVAIEFMGRQQEEPSTSISFV